MSTFQTVTRSGSIDAGHRICRERVKCYHLHGHTYLYEMTFSFNSMPAIDGSYAIDFKEIKRVFQQFEQDYMDHGMYLNPHDTEVIDCVKKLGTKMWLMSLYGEGNFCNPSAENIAKELFLCMKVLAEGREGGLKMHELRLWETPNCSTTCTQSSITEDEENNFRKAREPMLLEYKKQKGIFDYDSKTGTCATSHIEN